MTYFSHQSIIDCNCTMWGDVSAFIIMAEHANDVYDEFHQLFLEMLHLSQ